MENLGHPPPMGPYGVFCEVPLLKCRPSFSYKDFWEEIRLMGELIEYGKYAGRASCELHCELQVDMRVAF